jgi:hypothetical protein
MSNLYGNHITRLCELAIRAYLRGLGLAQIPVASILAGFDDAEIMTPRVVIVCDSADNDGPADDATWKCKVEIQCISNADDRTKGQHYELASEVWSQLMLGRYSVPDLINTACQISDPLVYFRCFDIVPDNQSKRIEDRRWISTMTFQVVGCGLQSEALDEGGEALLEEGGSVLYT